MRIAPTPPGLPTPASLAAANTPAAPSANTLADGQVVIGGGPRSTAQVAAEMALIQERAGDIRRLRSLGARYQPMKTVIVERQGVNFIGSGLAFGPDQGGCAANTPAEDFGGYSARMAQLIDPQSSFTRTLQDRLEGRVPGDPGAPVAAALLRRATDGSYGLGSGNMPYAALQRNVLGVEENTHFMRLVDSLSTCPTLSEHYDLQVLTHTEARSIDLTDPTHPRVGVGVSGTGSAVHCTLAADSVRLHTGYTMRHPLPAQGSAQALRPYTFTGSMNSARLRNFLQEQGLLNAHGMLRPDARLVLGGASLSTYDILQALNPYTRLLEFRPDAPGYIGINAAAARTYQGALTAMSRTPGAWVPPRHAPDGNWTQSTPTLLTPRQAHALTLHGNGTQLYDAGRVLERAAFALASASTPETLEPFHADVRARLASDDVHNQTHFAALNRVRDTVQGARPGDYSQQVREAVAAHTLASTRTPHGAMRQAALSLQMGLGISRDMAADRAAMERDAPLTFGGRDAYLMLRASVAAFTDAQNPLSYDASHQATRDAAAVHAQRVRHITASPATVHQIAHQLMEAGVLRHVVADYAQLQTPAQAGAEPAGKPLVLAQSEGPSLRFDALIAANVADRSASPVLQSLRNQVTPVHPQHPDVGRVVANRMVLARDGRLAHVEDYSLNGAGVPVTQDAQGRALQGLQSTLVGAFAWDVNNRESAIQVARGNAVRRLAQQHLAAAGLAQPIETLEALYRRELPSEREHAREVQSFAPDFDAAQRNAAWARAAERACTHVPGTPTQRAQVYRHLLLDTPASARRSGTADAQWARRLAPGDGAGIAAPALLQALRSARGHYSVLSATLPEFDPVQRDAFHARFVDTPLHLHEKVYSEALNMAQRHLELRSQQSLESRRAQHAVATQYGLH